MCAGQIHSSSPVCALEQPKLTPGFWKLFTRVHQQKWCSSGFPKSSFLFISAVEIIVEITMFFSLFIFPLVSRLLKPQFVFRKSQTFTHIIGLNQFLNFNQLSVKVITSIPVFPWEISWADKRQNKT